MIIVGGDDLSREYLEEIHSKLSEVAFDIHMKVSHEARSILHRGIIDQRGDPMENIEGAGSQLLGSQLLRVIAAHPPLLPPLPRPMVMRTQPSIISTAESDEQQWSFDDASLSSSASTSVGSSPRD